MQRVDAAKVWYLGRRCEENDEVQDPHPALFKTCWATWIQLSVNNGRVESRWPENLDTTVFTKTLCLHGAFKEMVTDEGSVCKKAEGENKEGELGTLRALGLSLITTDRQTDTYTHNHAHTHNHTHTKNTNPR